MLYYSRHCTEYSDFTLCHEYAVPRPSTMGSQIPGQIGSSRQVGSRSWEGGKGQETRPGRGMEWGWHSEDVGDEESGDTRPEDWALTEIMPPMSAVWFSPAFQNALMFNSTTRYTYCFVIMPHRLFCFLSLLPIIFYNLHNIDHQKKIIKKWKFFKLFWHWGTGVDNNVTIFMRLTH